MEQPQFFEETLERLMRDLGMSRASLITLLRPKPQPPAPMSAHYDQLYVQKDNCRYCGSTREEA